MARGTELNYIHPQYGNQNANTYMGGVKDTIKKHPDIDVVF